MRCRAEYVSGNTPSDYLLTGGFLGAHLLLGKSWWVSLVFLAAWLGVTAYFHRSGYFGPIHTFIAAILVASLWFPGLAVRDAIPAGVLAKWGGNLFAVAVGGALLCAIAVLWLDKRAAPALRQKDAARRGKGSPEPGIRTSSRRFHGLLMMGCQDKSTGSAAS
jgi:hypothetical protein